MTEPKPDIQKEAEREKLAHDFYKFYFLLGEVLGDIDHIMTGKDSPDFGEISDDEKERRAVLRHGVGSWIMAPTMPVMSGRMEKFVGPEKNIHMDEQAEALLQVVGNQKFTWKKRIERTQDFIKQCLDSLYSEMPIGWYREKFGGNEKENEWLANLTEEEKKKQS